MNPAISPRQRLRIWCKIYVAVTVALIALIGHFVASWLLRDWTWFARAGASITVIGGFLSVWRLVRLGPDGIEKADSVIDYGSIGEPTEEEALAAIQKRADLIAQTWGLAFVIIGTFVWGYGDLLGKLEFLSRSTP